ncbi:hypothetical protein ACHAXT_001685 [Thalassiosira profunda]
MAIKGAADASSASPSGIAGEEETTPIAVAVAVAVPSAPPLEHADSRPLPDADEEAQASAAAAREEGIATIRHHCTQHLALNPESSYCTWIATLHPENAEVSIDPRFLIEGNPCLAVYEEARSDLQKARGCESEGVVATPVASGAAQQSTHGGDGGTRHHRAGLLDAVMGSLLVLVGVSTSFVLELIAAYCYLSFWLCRKIVNTCSPSTVFTCLPRSIAFVIGALYQLLDALLLVVSVIVVECIAGANYVVCTILGCSHYRGRFMHQATRKLPHLVRWAFRKRFEKWDPPRRTHFGWCAATSES